jgi:hypothetical protein
MKEPAAALIAPRPDWKLGLFTNLGTPQINAFHFTLYDSGLVIFARTTETNLEEFFSVELTPEEVLGLLDDLPIAEFRSLQTAYGIDESSPTYYIAVPEPETGALVVVKFTGRLSEQGRHCERNRKAPEAFARIYERLDSYSHPRERPWFPDEVTVQVARAESGPACPWPADWEGWRSENSVPVSSTVLVGESEGTIHAKGRRLRDIQNFLADCKRLNGDSRVLLDGQPVRMFLTIRLPHQAR